MLLRARKNSKVPTHLADVPEFDIVKFRQCAVGLAVVVDFVTMCSECAGVTRSAHSQHANYGVKAYTC